MQAFSLAALLVAMAGLLAVVSVGAAATVGCPAPVSLTLCGTPTTSNIDLITSLVARFTVEYYTSGPTSPGFSQGAVMGLADVPNLSWSFNFLGDGQHTTRNVVRAWAIDGRTDKNCDAFLGPGYSSLAQAMSPMVEPSSVWIAPLASSDSLSDKAAHPAFNRVVPRDRVAVSMATAVFRKFDWKSINVFCFDDSYGQSLTEGLQTAMTALGGRVEKTQCTRHIETIEPAAVRSILDAFLHDSPSRVIYMAMYTNAAFTTIIDTIKIGGYDSKFIFVFSEAACSTSALDYLKLSSALCATYLANATRNGPFVDAYKARNLAPVTAALTAVGLGSTSSSSYTSVALLNALTHDATLHAMRSLLAFHGQSRNCTLPATSTVLAQSESQRRISQTSPQSQSSSTIPHARISVPNSSSRRAQVQSSSGSAPFATAVTAVHSVHTDGFTGPIDLDTNGDRHVINAVMFNAVDGAEVPIANILGDSVVFLDATGAATPSNALPSVQLLATMHHQSVPAATFPPEPSQFWTQSVIVAFAAGGVVLILLVVVVVFIITREGSARDNSNAPNDATKPFAIAFTDIQASTSLWARSPEQMSEAVDFHHAAIRHLIAKHKGYEVKTIGDSFMVAFHDPNAAVVFGLAIQTHLRELTWGTSVFDEFYKEVMLDAGLDATVINDESRYGEIWNGLRVRVGVHYGMEKVQVDPVTKGYDYYGTVVNTAARVEAVGNGGQTLVTRAVLDGLECSRKSDRRTSTPLDPELSDCIPGASVVDKGAQSLRGLDDAVWLFQVLPTALAAREFPPLRLDIEVDDNELDGSSASSYSVTSTATGGPNDGKDKRTSKAAAAARYSLSSVGTDDQRRLGGGDVGGRHRSRLSAELGSAAPQSDRGSVAFATVEDELLSLVTNIARRRNRRGRNTDGPGGVGPSRTHSRRSLLPTDRASLSLNPSPRPSSLPALPGAVAAVSRESSKPGTPQARSPQTPGNIELTLPTPNDSNLERPIAKALGSPSHNPRSGSATQQSPNHQLQSLGANDQHQSSGIAGLSTTLSPRGTIDSGDDSKERDCANCALSHACGDQLQDLQALQACTSLSMIAADANKTTEPIGRLASPLAGGPLRVKASVRCGENKGGAITSRSAVAGASAAFDKDCETLALLASFVRKMFSVVPVKERHRTLGHYAKRWHAKVTAPNQVRRISGGGAGSKAVEKYQHDAAEVRTAVALVERVWLALGSSSLSAPTMTGAAASLDQTPRSAFS